MINSRFSTAFDIGYNSIGWAVLEEGNGNTESKIVGCGTLIFPSEDNQNQARSAFRRQRRNIASKRNRISRIRKLLVERGMVTESRMQELNRSGGGHPSPWILAAQAINGVELDAEELTHVLVWYAHNRGYDGNSKWAREASKEDTEKVSQAKVLMQKHGTETMADTWVKLAGVDLTPDGKHSSTYYLKGESVSFPRETVEREVQYILEKHCGKICGVDELFIRLLKDDLSEEEKSKFKLPKRYSGGLLFGQMIPRFDNRIIPTCPISGAKVPLKFCQEFFHFRWGMLLANMRILDGQGKSRPLTPEERQEIHDWMATQGATTKDPLKKELARITGADVTPLDDLFFTPESDHALVLEPALKVLRSTEKFKGLIGLLNENSLDELKKLSWKKKSFSLLDLQQIAQANECDLDAINDQVSQNFAKAQKRKKKTNLDFVEYVKEEEDLKKYASGRSPYSRPLMTRAFEQMLKGLHPSATEDQQPAIGGVENGCLVRTEEVIERVLKQDLDEMSNNHLVRHRIKMFERLYTDIIRKYVNGDVSLIKHTTVEVADDIQEFSGMNSKEKAAHFSSKTAAFRDAEKYLLKRSEEEGLDIECSYNNIRKVRIAIAQDWKCAYTGKCFGLVEIKNQDVEREHIIPYSKRPSNSLDSLVLAYATVNRKKGNKTAWEFIEEHQGDVYGNCKVRSLADYKKWVDSLNDKKGLGDEPKIRKSRKQKLLQKHFESDEEQFLPRMLTATSYLNKLAALKARHLLREMGLQEDAETNSGNLVGHIPGRITAEFRSRWCVMDLLGEVCPEVVDASGRLRTKSEIRDITHMHHAVDAITLALVRYRIPQADKSLYEAILKRSPSEEDKKRIKSTGLFLEDPQGKLHIADLPEGIKKSITTSLAEERVVQHVPATMSGLKVEQTIWGVKDIDEETQQVTITQYTDLPKPKGKQRRVLKETQEHASKLLGVKESTAKGKLNAIKGAVVISDNYGIALTNHPQIIRYCRVYQQLEELGFPQVLRRGHIIDVPEGRYKGKWRIRSAKQDAKMGIVLDLSAPGYVSSLEAVMKKRGIQAPRIKRNVSLKTLLKSGMELVHGNLIE